MKALYQEKGFNRGAVALADRPPADCPEANQPKGQTHEPKAVYLEPAPAPSAEITLTKGQERAEHALKEFLKSDEKFLVLKGYAGTGKTTVVTRFLRHFYRTNLVGSVCLTAIANKAVGVLSKMVAEVDLPRDCSPDAQTIAALLGLKPTYCKETGRLIFEQNPKTKADPTQYKLIIVDECSMIGEDAFYKIIGALSGLFTTTKVVFMGDIEQLPPVGEELSPVFSMKIKPEFSLELDEVVRYDGHVGLTAEAIRSTDWVSNPIVHQGHNDEKTKGIWQVPHKGLESVVSKAFTSPKYDADPDSARVLCYTNAERRRWNALIHGWRYGKHADPYVEGMTLIADSPVTRGESILMSTSQEGRVTEAHQGKLEGWKVWVVTVETYSFNGSTLPSTYALNILHESERGRADALLKEFAERKDWATYWDFKGMFADVAPAYALTVHKSQGSTFKDVFIPLDNLWRCRDKKELKKLAYVAFSRASHRVFFAR